MRAPLRTAGDDAPRAPPVVRLATGLAGMAAEVRLVALRRVPVPGEGRDALGAAPTGMAWDVVVVAVRQAFATGVWIAIDSSPLVRSGVRVSALTYPA